MRTKGVNIERSGKQDQSVLKNALKMAFGTMTSRILGQVRESLLAYYYDVRVTDAWSAAFKVPNLFRRLLGEGSLSVSFIPVFVDASQDSQKRAQNLVNSVYTFLLIILGCLTVFGILNPEPLMRVVLDPSFIADQEKYIMTLRMAKIMFGFVFFISSYAFVMGILNALGHFALPAVAPTFLNVAMIASMFWPDSWVQNHGDQLAYGVLFGGVLQSAILLPALIKSGYFPRLSFDFKNLDFLRVLRNMAPGLVGMGLLQFTTIINLRFSSSLAEGTISYINYVDRLIELPLSLISVSLGTALLPALAKLKNQNENLKFAETTRQFLELNLLMTMAAAAGLYVLAEPIVQLLFGRGRFHQEHVATTAAILQTYCWIMIFSSGVRVLTPAYYAVKNTWFPAIISFVCLVVHLIIAPILMERYQVHGLMMSTIVSATLNLSLLLVFYNKFIGQFSYLKFFKSIVTFVPLALATAWVSQIHFLISDILPKGLFFQIINISISIGLALVAFVTVGTLFKIKAVTDISQKVLARIKRQ
jgi:putative peptidoglycan lipid II flippase